MNFITPNKELNDMFSDIFRKQELLDSKSKFHPKDLVKVSCNWNTLYIFFCNGDYTNYSTRTAREFADISFGKVLEVTGVCELTDSRNNLVKCYTCENSEGFIVSIKEDLLSAIN